MRPIAVAENSTPSDEEILDLVDDECVEIDNSELGTPDEPVAESSVLAQLSLPSIQTRLHGNGTAERKISKQTAVRNEKGAKRTRLNMKQQLAVVRAKESGARSQNIASRFNTTVSSVNMIYALRAKLRKGVLNFNHKGVRRAMYPEVDEALLELTKRYRKAGTPLTLRLSQANAEKIFKRLLDDTEMTAEGKEHLKKFKVSLKCVRNFIGRCGLRSKRLHGEA